MFAGFNLEVDINSFINNIVGGRGWYNYYKEIGSDHLSQKSNDFSKNLKDYVLNGITDGTKLQDNWFPEIKADIFISHSHADKDLATALVGWLLYNFRLECFIDSYAWGHIDDLLSQINNEYSDKREGVDGGILYDHNKCNKASAHVNMMLNIALQKMIDNTEAVFLINTSNSIEKYSAIYKNSTYSPWIYSEIACTQIIRMKELSNYRKNHIINKGIINYNQLQIEYQVSLDHLTNIEYKNLNEWKDNWDKLFSQKYKYPLDELYKITHKEQFKNISKLQQS